MRRRTSGTAGCAKPGGFRLGVATTTVSNFIQIAAAGSTGILIARSLGPNDRGEYAAITAWFGVALVVGELGQTAATTFFVARNPGSAPRYVATSRNMMIASGLIVALVGCGVSPLLASGSDAALSGYILMFATCVFSSIGASYTFSLQALNTASWNIVRASQPIVFGVGCWAFQLSGHLNLLTCLLASSLTIALQTLTAYSFCFRAGLTGGSGDRTIAKEMSRYGLLQMAGAVPSILIARLDQLALSIAVRPEALGQYAVAVSFTSLAVPAVSAIGSVAFPKIALYRKSARGDGYVLEKHAISATIGVSLVTMVGIIACAQWMVPRVFGAEYSRAVSLVWILAPGMAALACSQVCSDILRGHGRLLALARAQWISAAAMIAGLLVLLPILGDVGAAISSASSSWISAVFVLRELRRARSLATGLDSHEAARA
jgi:O-antigen/teichoic acid export membrane protein